MFFYIFALNLRVFNEQNLVSDSEKSAEHRIDEIVGLATVCEM